MENRLSRLEQLAGEEQREQAPSSYGWISGATIPGNNVTFDGYKTWPKIKDGISNKVLTLQPHQIIGLSRMTCRA